MKTITLLSLCVLSLDIRAMDWNKSQADQYNVLPAGIVKACIEKDRYNQSCTHILNMFNAARALARLHIEPEETRVKHRFDEANSALELNTQNINKKIKALLIPAVMHIVEGEMEPALQEKYIVQQRTSMDEALEMAHTFHNELKNIKKSLLQKINDESEMLRESVAQGSSILKLYSNSLFNANERYQSLYREAGRIYSHLREENSEYWRIPYEKAATLRLIRKCQKYPHSPPHIQQADPLKYVYNIWARSPHEISECILYRYPELPLYKKLIEIAKEHYPQ